MATKSKRSTASEKIIHGADQERQLPQPPEIIRPIWGADVYHSDLILPSNWKRLEVEVSGNLKTETNSSKPTIELLGASVPAAIKDTCLSANGWGYTHNSYQYADDTYVKGNMFDGKAMFVSMPIGGGYYYGDNTFYRWHFTATALPENRVMIHSDIAGNRREERQTHWIIQAAFNMQPNHIESIDIGFEGQLINISGTARILAYDAP